MGASRKAGIRRGLGIRGTHCWFFRFSLVDGLERLSPVIWRGARPSERGFLVKRWSKAIEHSIAPWTTQGGLLSQYHVQQDAGGFLVGDSASIKLLKRGKNCNHIFDERI